MLKFRTTRRPRALAVTAAGCFASAALVLGVAGPASAATPTAAPGHVTLCADGDYAGVFGTLGGGALYSPTARPGHCVSVAVPLRDAITSAGVTQIFVDRVSGTAPLAYALVNTVKGAVIDMKGSGGDGGKDAYLSIHQNGVSSPRVKTTGDPTPGYFNLCVRGNYEADAPVYYKGSFYANLELTPGYGCQSLVIAAFGDKPVQVAVWGFYNNPPAGARHLSFYIGTRTVNPYQGVTIDTLGTAGSTTEHAWLHVHQQP